MDDNPLDRLVAEVRAGARYRTISADLVRRVGEAELAKRRSFKEAVKATRSKLHQVGGAYLETIPPYKRWEAELASLGSSPEKEALKELCRKWMVLHISTRDRLTALDRFYTEPIGRIAPIQSILDLASGLNPLAIPWMPLAEGATYTACDIYADMVEFIQFFFNSAGVKGRVQVCDLVRTIPPDSVQLALLLNTIPCLEQQEPEIGRTLMESIHAEHILVSFPVHSLGGHAKGMLQNYGERFGRIIAGKPWKVERFEIGGELVFLVDKG